MCSSGKQADTHVVVQAVCMQLTVTPGLLSCLNRLKGAHERALCGCDGVCAGTGRGVLQDARGCLVALGSQQAPSLCSRLSIRYVGRL